MDARVRDILKKVENNEISTVDAYKIIQQFNTHKETSKVHNNMDIYYCDSTATTTQNELIDIDNNKQLSSSTEVLINEVEKHLCRSIAALLGVELEEVSKLENFMDLGIDSTSLIKMTSEIEKEWDLELYPTLFFEYQNITDLANYFANQYKDKLLKVFNVKEKRVISSSFDSINPKNILSDSKVSALEEADTTVDANIGENANVSTHQTKMSHVDNSDIAIIGMSGIFPESQNLNEFWENIVKGNDLIREIPSDHFDYTPWFDSNPNNTDKIYTKWGGFLNEVDTFDAAFFNISPKEAIMMDPQLRLLLQVLYETVEDAGYPQKIKGSNTGMYVGACFHDYDEELSKHMNTIDPYLGTGNAASMISNRPSFFFDLKGPSLTVDTACSSSLVALHLAIRALRNKECDMALVAGVNLLLSPKHYQYFCSIGALSPSGRCHTFDKEADGYIPAEGIASLLIKPLVKAVEDGDRIYAVIKGSAVNHGGYTPSVTAPSSKQEAAVITAAWEDAHIAPNTLDYFEAHGTGTKLGDPIEINGINSAFEKYTKEESFCYLGSTKAHIGHAEGAAGIAGIIKTVLSMKNQVIPAMPTFRELNPFIDLKGAPVQINKNAIEWKRKGDTPRRAGISSFGFGGTYAHVVVEDFETIDSEKSEQENIPQLIVMSAKNKDRLYEQILNLINYLIVNSEEQVLGDSLDQKLSNEITQMIAEILEINLDDIDRQDDFFEYGLDQIGLSELAQKIYQKYCIEVSNDVILGNSSIEKFTKFLSDNYNEKILTYYPGTDKSSKIIPDKKPSLIDIAYTLQTGREMMEERCAVIASDVDELLSKLNEFYHNNKVPDDLFVGNVKSSFIHTELLLQVLKGEEYDKLIKGLIQKKDLLKLAKLWISGVYINWNLLYAKERPKRLSLPTYPFAKEHFWSDCLKNPVDNYNEEVISQYNTPINPIVNTGYNESEINKTVSKIWGDCLGIKTVNQDDNFAEIGGNSIAASQILSQINAIYSIEIPPSKFVDVPTVAELSNLINLELVNRKSKEDTESKTNNDTMNDYVAIIPKRNSNNPTILTSDQKRIWFLNKVDQNNNRHNIPALFHVKGNLNFDILSQSYNQVISEHEALRTSFGYDNDKPVQIVHDKIETCIELIDLQTLDTDLQNEKIQEIFMERVNIPFVLEKAPLVKMSLINLGNQNYILAIVIHHIISDIWSLGILVQQLFDTYDLLLSGKIIDRPERQIHMADYAQWNGDRLDVISSKHLPYWKDKLYGASDLLNLPTDKNRPEHQTFNSGQVKFVLPGFIYAKVLEQVKSSKTTLFITMLSAFKIILHKASGQEDILVGSPVANRGLIETKDMIGFLANTLVLRTKILSTMSFMDVVKLVEEVTYGALDHQEISYSNVVEAVQPKRNTSYNPLFQVMFNFLAMPKYKNSNLDIELVDQELPTTDFDMTLRVEERNSKLYGFIDYKKDLFDVTTMNGYAEALIEVLKEATIHPDTKICDIKLPDVITRSKHQVELNNIIEESIIVSSTFTAEPLKDTIEFWMRNLGFDNSVQFSQYNQVYQQLLDPNQLLLKNSSGINIIMLRFEDWIRNEEGLSTFDKIAIIHRNLDEFVNIVTSASLQMTVPLIIILCPSDFQNNDELLKCYETCSEELVVGLDKLERVYTITPNDIAKTYEISNIFDTQANKIGHVPFTMRYFTVLGTIIARKIRALKHAPYKVIVLDCDQTLWKGICGEVGPDGIEIDESYRKFHELLVDQYKSGTLLCLCSKNNENDVLDVFKNRLDMPLKLEYMVANRINWQAKSENIKELSNELNLGLDSFIFIDDNPMEIEEVKANTPEVYTIQYPTDNPAGIDDIINHTWVFDKINISQEDKKRTGMYKQDVERKKSELMIPSYADFIKSLNLNIDIAPIADEEFNRVEQLMIRTNQFNTTTIRYSAEDIKKLIKSNENHCLTVKVTDRFGDYGLVGVVLYSVNDNTIIVDSLILSCRILGKGIEHNILSKIGDIAVTMGKDFVSVKYVKTEKNAPVKEFLDNLQIELHNSSDEVIAYEISSIKCKDIEFIPNNSEVKNNTIHKKLSVPFIRPGKKMLESIPMAFNNIDNVIATINSEKKTKSLNLDKGEEMPQGELEEKIATIYKDILNLNYVGVERNFFELGGNSLLLVQLNSKLMEISRKEISITDLFKYPTVRSLSEFLRNTEKIKLTYKGQTRGERQRNLLMQFRGTR